MYIVSTDSCKNIFGNKEFESFSSALQAVSEHVLNTCDGSCEPSFCEYMIVNLDTDEATRCYSSNQEEGMHFALAPHLSFNVSEYRMFEAREDAIQFALNNSTELSDGAYDLQNLDTKEREHLFFFQDDNQERIPRYKFRHAMFEWMVCPSGEVVKGDCIEDVFDALPNDVIPCGDTVKSKCRIALINYGIENIEMPTFQEISKHNYIDVFFDILEEMGKGAWKWYDSLYGDRFRYDPYKNDVVPRLGLIPRKLSPEIIEVFKKNIEKSHEARRANKELAIEIGKKAGYASAMAKKKKTSSDVIKKLVEGRRKYLSNLTPEEKEAWKEQRRVGQRKRWDRVKQSVLFEHFDKNLQGKRYEIHYTRGDETLASFDTAEEAVLKIFEFEKIDSDKSFYYTGTYFVCDSETGVQTRGINRRWTNGNMYKFYCDPRSSDEEARSALLKDELECLRLRSAIAPSTADSEPSV